MNQRQESSSKPRKVGRAAPRAPRIGKGGKASGRLAPERERKPGGFVHDGARGATRPTTLRREFRAWRASLPTQLERDTLLMPEAIAESVVQEAERFLKAELPANYAARLAAKAQHLYPRHKHFQKVLNHPGNRGRHNLYVYMRHWTCSWLKRERRALYRQLPWSYAVGRALPC